jgi:hypothetical protein
MTLAGGNDDRHQIAEVMTTYVEAARSGRTEDLRGLFHGLATICGHDGPDLFAGPIQLFFDWLDENGPAPGIRVSAKRIEVEGKAACVRLLLDDWTGRQVSECFTLVEIDGRWLILSKVFHLHAG